MVNKVDRRLSWEAFREDIMSHTLREAKDGKSMSMEEIYYNFAFLAVAGSETSATVLAGTLNHLSSEVTVRRHILDEVRAAFENEGEITLSRVVEQCEYLTAVIKEGLRLCAPVPWIPPRIVYSGGEIVWDLAAWWCKIPSPFI